jgi:hypothetical protein
MHNPERSDDDGTAREWVERLIGRSWQATAIIGALEEAERQADEARQQLRGAVDPSTEESLRTIVAALEGFRDELGGSTRDRVDVARREAREALDRLRGAVPMFGSNAGALSEQRGLDEERQDG